MSTTQSISGSKNLELNNGVAVKFEKKHQHQEEALSEFDVKEMIVMDGSVIFSFEVFSKDPVTLPSCNIRSALQGNKRLKTSFKRGMCEVYKSGEIYEGSLVARNGALNSHIDFVLLNIRGGTTVKIVSPEKVVCKPDIVTVTPKTDKLPMKLTISMENVLVTDFFHTLTESKGDDYKEDGFYMEQSILFNNTSLFTFNNCNTTKIVVPKTNKETEHETENGVLTLKDVGSLDSHSKESCYFSDTRLENPVNYVMVSTINHERSEMIKEFKMDQEIFPGELSEVNASGEIENTSDLPYKNKGDKLMISGGHAKHIVVLESNFTETGFSLVLENSSGTNENIKIEEYEEIEETTLDGVRCNDHVIEITPGKCFIEGIYSGL
jgi:hypothetical protein